MTRGAIELYVMIGIPGSGKSTIVDERFDDWLYGDENFNILQISALETIQMLGNTHEEDDKEVVHSMYNQLYEALEFAEETFEQSGTPTEIYFDARNLNRKKRRALYKHIKELNEEVVVIGALVCVSLVEAMARNMTRPEFQQVPEEDIRKLYTKLQIPRLGADCDVLSITGAPMFSRPIKELTCEGLLQAVHADYKEELNLFQDHGCAPHHTESIDQHIENAVTLAKGIREKHVALFHDLGKPICRREDETGYATYRDHASVGAYYLLNYMYSLRLMGEHTELTTEDAEVVHQHMNAHQGLGEKNIRNNNLYPILDRIYQFAKIDKKAARPSKEV